MGVFDVESESVRRPLPSRDTSPLIVYGEKGRMLLAPAHNASFENIYVRRSHGRVRDLAEVLAAKAR